MHDSLKDVRLSTFFAALVLSSGCVVLLSWVFDFAPPESQFTLIAMNPLTAVSFLLCGGALFLLSINHKHGRKIAKITASVVLAIVLIKFLSFLGFDLRLDQILFTEKLESLTAPNRMAPNTALTFFCMGLALFFHDKITSRGHLLRDYFLIPALFFAMTAFIGHIYASSLLTQVRNFIPMAFNTALTFLALNLGIMALNLDQGLISIFNKKYAGAKVGRRLLWYVTCTPLILGWLRGFGEKHGLFGPATGAAMMAMVAVILGLILLSGSAHIVNKLEETLEKKKLAEAERRLNRLKRFFPKAIAEKILSGEIEDPFKWHRNDVTVVFIDLRGFTSFSELGEPEEVMTTLQDYYQTIARIAESHGGSIGHLAGDGVMIFFNDPVPVENPQIRAALMSLEIREALNRLCSNWNSKDLSLNFGAGIASGYTTIGGIGSEGFWDYTVIGTAPNVASRLCHVAQGGQILISRRFLSSISEAVEVEGVGTFELKGIHKPVTTYNITHIKNNVDSRL